jgi:hypothetical protein
MYLVERLSNLERHCSQEKKHSSIPETINARYARYYTKCSIY